MWSRNFTATQQKKWIIAKVTGCLIVLSTQQHKKMLIYQKNNNKLSWSEQQCLSRIHKNQIVLLGCVMRTMCERKERDRTHEWHGERTILWGGKEGAKNIKAHQSATSDFNRWIWERDGSIPVIETRRRGFFTKSENFPAEKFAHEERTNEESPEESSIRAAERRREKNC